jgi:hypothetical protein
LTRPDRRFRPRPIDALERRTYFSPLTFSAPATYPTGLHPDAIAAADLTGSGVNDVVTADFSANTVSVLMGNGNGAFQAPVAYAVGGSPEAVAIADLNGDGHPDIVTADESTDTISILFNNGDGTFAPAVQYAVGVRPEGIAFADFNNNGLLDIVTSNEGASSVSVLTNVGNGTFTPAATFFCGLAPGGVAIGDFNGDGLPDIVVTNPSLNEVTVLRNTGTGDFDDLLSYPTGDAPVAIAVADLNADGRPDVVTADLHAATISLLLGNGDGTFQASVDTGTGAFPFSVSTGDLNGDGRTDVVTSNSYDNDVSVLLRNGLGAFAIQHGVKAGQAPEATVAADVNGDGRDDLVTADFNTSVISVSLNQTIFVPLVPTTTTLTVGQSTVQLGNKLLLTATVSTAGAVKKTGIIQFFAGDRVLGVVAINPFGVARLATSALDLGDTVLTAHYGGDSIYGASTGGPLTETVVEPAAAVPYLVPSVPLVGLSSTFVPGDRGSAVVSIFDQGAGTARGSVAVDLALVPTDPTEASVPVATDVQVNLAVTGGRTVNPRIGFTVPADIEPGGYTISAALVPVSGLSADEVDTDTVTAATTQQGVLGFGTVGSHLNYRLVRTLPNGATVTVSLLGGTGTLVEDGGGQIELSLSGTSPGSKLAVTATGPVNVAGISNPGTINTVAIDTAELSGAINLGLGVARFTAENVDDATIVLGGGPLTTMTLGAVAGVSLSSPQAFTALSVASWTNSAADQITIPWITTLASTGDFGSNMDIPGANRTVSLRTVAIGGAITGGIWAVAQQVDSIAAHGVDAGWSADVRSSLLSLTDTGDFEGALAAGYLGAFRVTGAVTDAMVLVGTDFGPDGLPGGGDDQFHAGTIGSIQIGSSSGSVIAAGLLPAVDAPFTVGGSLIAGGTIRSITVTGTADAASKFLTASLPRQVRIAGVVLSPAGDARFEL